MSMNFEIFPTKKYTPNCSEIIKYSVELFSEFLKKENILQRLDISAIEVTDNSSVYTKPISLVLKDNYGYLAIAIAILTGGIIYSDDGAWDYSMLPIEGEDFKTEYLNLENISDYMLKENVEKWLGELKGY